MSNVGRKLAHLFTIPINFLSSVTEEGGFIASIAVAFFGRYQTCPRKVICGLENWDLSEFRVIPAALIVSRTARSLGSCTSRYHQYGRVHPEDHKGYHSCGIGIPWVHYLFQIVVY